MFRTTISIEQLTGIRAFVETAQAGSFTLAGERLALTRSAVGKAVARLESQLDTRLLHRTTRKLSLTVEGQAFYARCARALAELQQGEADLRLRQGVVAGPLRIALPVLFGRQWVLPVLLDIAKAHPALELDVYFSSQPVDMTDGRFDLAVRIGTPPDKAGLVARSLGVQRTVMCASSAYLAEHGEPTLPADLLAHACLVERLDSSWQLLDETGQLRAITAPVRMALHDSAALRDAALAGLGLGALPRWLVAADLAAGRLREVLPGSGGTGLPINVLWKGGRKLAVRQRVVIDELVRRFAPEARWDE